MRNVANTTFELPIQKNNQSINHQLNTENEIQNIRSITHKHKNPHNKNASQRKLNKITNAKARINDIFKHRIKKKIL